MDTSDLQSQLTRDILLCYVDVEAQFLLHGHSPMAQKGGFSWCPLTIFDGQTLHGRVVSDMQARDKVYIDGDGAVSGAWKFQTLEKEDVNKLRPHSFHISNNWRIHVALRNWHSCLVLRPLYSDQKPGPALLATVIDIGDWEIYDDIDYKRTVVECQYVGSVHEELTWPSKAQKISIRFGKTAEDPHTSAKEVVSLNSCTTNTSKNAHALKERYFGV